MRLDRQPRLAAPLAAAALVALATIALGACGGDDEQTLTYEVDGAKVTGPESADSGPAEITLDNVGKRPAGLQWLRVEGDRSPQEFLNAFGAVLEEQAPIPDWIFAAGGVGTTAGGQSQTVTETLEPGTYYGINIDGPRPQPDLIARLEVSGEESDEELEADLEVDAIDYGFENASLESGENEVLFRNTGAQPHHILASKAIGDATVEDVERFFRTEGGKPPIRERGTQSTAVIEGGDSQLVTLDLEPGKYILYCFISDRQGGPPHALKGMVDEVEVK